MSSYNNRHKSPTRTKVHPMETYDKNSSTPLLNTGPVPKTAHFRNNMPLSGGGFLAAEQFSQAYRDDDISNLTSLPDPALNVSHTYEPFDSNGSKQEHMCEVDMEGPTKDARVFIQKTIESVLPFPAQEHQQRSSSTSRRNRNTHQKEKRGHSSPPKKSSNRSRSKSSRARVRPRQESKHNNDDNHQQWQRVGQEKLDGCAAVSMNLRRRLGECMLVQGGDLYRDQYETARFRTQEAAACGGDNHHQRQYNDYHGGAREEEEAKEHPPWLEEQRDIKSSEDNSLLLSRKGTRDDMGSSSPTYLPLTTESAPQAASPPRQQQQQQQQQQQSKEDANSSRISETIDGTNCSDKAQMEHYPSNVDSNNVQQDDANGLRSLRLGLFQGDNHSVVVPQARLARALAELVSQDKTIQNLHLELTDMKKELEQAKKDREALETQYQEDQNKRDQISVSAELDGNKERSAGNTSPNAIMSLRTEIVTLRSQLADAKAEVLESKTVASHESTKEQEIQKLQRQLSQSEEKIKILEIEKEMAAHTAEINRNNLKEEFSTQLMEIQDKISELSRNSKEDERRMMEAKKSLQLELEQTTVRLKEAKAEVSKSRNELFNNRLKLAQAESRAESFENLAKTRQMELLKRRKEQNGIATEKPDILSRGLAGDFRPERERELTEQLAQANLELEKLKAASKAPSKESRQEEEALSSKKSLEAELGKAHEELDKLRWELSHQKLLIAKAEADKEGAEKLLKSSNEKQASLSRDSANLKSEISQMEKQQLQMQEDLQSSNDKQASLSRDTANLKSEISQMEKQQSQMQEDLDRSQQRIVELESHARDAETKLALSEKMVGLLENQRDSSVAELDDFRQENCFQREISQHAIDFYIRRLNKSRDNIGCASEKLDKATNVLSQTKLAMALMELKAVASLRGLRVQLAEMGEERDETRGNGQQNSSTISSTVKSKNLKLRGLSEELEHVREVAASAEQRKKALLQELDLAKQELEKQSSKTESNGHLLSKATQTGVGDSGDQGYQSKTDHLKKAQRRREVEFILRFHKNSDERVELAHELAQSREYNQILQSKISSLDDKLVESETELETLREEMSRIRKQSTGKQGNIDTTKQSLASQLISESKSEECVDSDAGKKAVKQDEPNVDVALLRSDLEEILSLLAETKRRWQQDCERADAELSHREETEVKLLAEIQELKHQVESHSATAEERGAPSTPQPVRSDSSVARLLAKASFVSRRKGGSQPSTGERQGNFNKASPSSSRLGPDDEPPVASLAFPTPLRNNRSTPQKNSTRTTNIIREPEGLESVAPTTKSDCNASVSTITFAAHAQNDYTSFLPTETGFDVVRSSGVTTTAPSSEGSGTGGRQQFQQERIMSYSGISSNVSDSSSILSPPVLSMALQRRPDLPEPVPVYASNGMPAREQQPQQQQVASSDASPSALDLVSQLKSLFERTSP